MSGFQKSLITLVLTVALGLFNTVISSSFAVGANNVSLNISNFTANPLRVVVFAAEAGLRARDDDGVVGNDFGEPGQAAFDAALSFIGPRERTLVLSPGNWGRPTGDVPANVTLHPERGAFIDPGETDLVINRLSRIGRYHWISPSGAGRVLLGRGAAAEVFPEWWGGDPDGVTDCSAALQAAIDCVPLLPATIYRPGISLASGKYNVLTPLNLTNTRVDGTISRDGVCIKGNGYRSVILGNTGGIVIDTCGSQFTQLVDFKIEAGATNPSTVGVFAAPNTTLNQCQNHVYDKLIINMGDNGAANGGLGTVGVCNMGAEEHSYRSVFWKANRPVVLSGSKAYIGAIDSSYQTVPKSHSLGVTTFSGECALFALGRRYPAVRTADVNSVSFYNTYITNEGTGGSNDVAMEVMGALDTLNFSGNVESLGTLFKITGRLSNGNVRANYGNVLNTSVPLIELQGPSEGSIRRSDISIQMSTHNTRNLISVLHNGSTPGAADAVSSYIQDTTIKANLAASYIALNQNLLKNSSTRNVQIFGSYSEIKIDRQTQEIYLSPVKVGEIGGITEANVCKVTLPAVVANKSSGNFTLILEGMVSNNSAGTRNPAVRSFKAMQNVVTRYSDGAIYISDADGGVAGNQANIVDDTATIAVNPSGLNIDAVAVKGTAAGVASVTFAVAPTLTGGGTGDSVWFTGRAKIVWNGFKARAPLLSLPYK
ncbi:MAG: hypothetical protein C4567_05760 [Deltaproteobacteria bacterium]|nr:MAG: hypothetical protein C4567_05760 [Deltaproteobacteria bacterium]